MAANKDIITSFDISIFETYKNYDVSSNVIPIKDIISSDYFINESNEKGGIYFFWWYGKKEKLIFSIKNCIYNLKGKRSLNQPVQIKFTDKWLESSTINDKICLYIGKSTNIRGRITKHIRPKTIDIWNNSEKTSGLKPNSESQLRIGIERIFNENIFNDDIINNIYISWIEINDYENSLNRFYLENYFIGKYFPLLNIDIER